MSPPTVSMQVDVDLNHPTIRDAIQREAEEKVAAAHDEAEEEIDELFEGMVSIRDALETARRHLTSPHPSPSEAMIYIERALAVTVRTR